MINTAPRDFRATHAALTGNVHAMLMQHPNAFEALLYRADPAAPETVSPDDDVVGALDSRERTLDYSDAITVKAMIVPDTDPIPLSRDGSQADGEQSEPVVLLLSVPSVPEESIIQWLEYVNETDTREIILYVVDSKQVGTTPGVCAKLYCLPMQDFEELIK